MKNKKRKSIFFKFNYIYIILLFILIASVSGFLLLKSNFVGFSDDLYFQWSRVFDIRQSVMHGNLFEPVALNKFYESGSAVMSMYPKLNLITLVLMSFFIKSFTHLVYASFMLKVLLSLLVSYFSCLAYRKNKLVSILFAVNYSLSSMVMFYSFSNMDIGVSSALVFMPLILFGTLELLSNNRFIELTIGFTIIFMVHVLTALIVLIFIISFVLFNVKVLKIKTFWTHSIKCATICLLMTSVFWIPLIVLTHNNVINMPYPFELSGTDPIYIINSVFNNNYSQFINIFALLGLVGCIVFYKKMEYYSRQLFWISIIFILVSSSLFPWSILNGTVINTIQFTWRLYIIPQLLLSYLFSENIIRLKYINNHKVISVCSIVLFSVISQISQQRQITEHFWNNRFDFSHIINDNASVNLDYFPKNALSLQDDINKHQVTYSVNEKVSSKIMGRGRFLFKLNRSANEVKIPFLIYNGINYQVKLDGNNYKFYSDKHSQLTINNVNKGKHTVQVIVHKSWYDYLSYVLSSLGIVILLYSLIKEYWLKRKNE